MLFSIVVLFVPLINQYIFGQFNFGGDSTRLFLKYPFKWIENYSLHVNNYTFVDNPYNSSFAVVPQLLIYSILNNLIFEDFIIYFHNSIICFSAFLGISMMLFDTQIVHIEINEIKKKIYLYISSIIYVFSASYAWSILNNGGNWVYVFASLPLLLSLSYRFCLNGNLKFLLIIFFLMNFYSSVFLYQMLPFTLPTFLCGLIIYFNRLKKVINKKFIYRIFLILLLIIFFNIPNIYYILNEFQFEPDQYSQINIQKNYVSGFKDIIERTRNNYFPIFHVPNLELFLSGNDKFVTTNLSYLKAYLVVNALIIFFLIYNVLKNYYIFQTKQIKQLKLISSSLLIGLILINPGFNELSKEIYFLLIEKFNFMGIFRGFYHKSSFGFSMIMSFFLFNSLLIIEKFTKYSLQIMISLFLFIIIPAILGIYYNISILYTEIKPFNGLSNDTKLVSEVLLKQNEKGYEGHMLSIPPRREYFLDYNDHNMGYVTQSPFSLLSGIYNYYQMVSDKTKNIYNEIENNKSFVEKFSLIKEYNIEYLLFQKNDYKEIFQAYQLNYDKSKVIKFKNNILNLEHIKIIFENDKYTLIKMNNNFFECINFKKKIFYYELNILCNDYKKKYRDFEKFKEINFLKENDIININEFIKKTNTSNKIKIYNHNQNKAYFLIVLIYLMILVYFISAYIKKFNEKI